LGVGSDWFGSLLEPSPIAIGSWYIIATDGMNQPEGLQFKAIKVVDQSQRNEPVWHMVRDNIRIPDLVVGDMNAQIAAAQIGALRFLDSFTGMAATR
jgi:N-methylhydantoinase B/oxoprolinase/acetone carboxylase alpha subunit